MKPDSDLVLHISVNVPGACKNQVNEMEANMKKDPSSVTIELVHEKLIGRCTRYQNCVKRHQEVTTKKPF